MQHRLLRSNRMRIPELLPQAERHLDATSLEQQALTIRPNSAKVKAMNSYFNRIALIIITIHRMVG